jgi:hypothetical protein
MWGQNNTKDPFRGVALGEWTRSGENAIRRLLPPRNIWQALNDKTQAVYVFHDERSDPGSQWSIDEPTAGNHPLQATLEEAIRAADKIVAAISVGADCCILKNADLHPSSWRAVVDPERRGTPQALRFEKTRPLGVAIAFAGDVEKPLDGPWSLRDVDGETRSFPTLKAAADAGADLYRYPRAENFGVGSLGRIVARPTSDGQPDLILGACFKNQPEDGLRPGRVYELRSVFGEFQLVDLGPSALGETAEDSAILNANWHGSADHILDVAGKHLTLTKAEFVQLRRQDADAAEAGEIGMKP